MPCLIFEKRFKSINHLFNKSVYGKAAKIEKYTADNMDTCMIKYVHGGHMYDQVGIWIGKKSW